MDEERRRKEERRKSGGYRDKSPSKQSKPAPAEQAKEVTSKQPPKERTPTRRSTEDVRKANVLNATVNPLLAEVFAR